MNFVHQQAAKLEEESIKNECLSVLFQEQSITMEKQSDTIRKQSAMIEVSQKSKIEIKYWSGKGW